MTRSFSLLMSSTTTSISWPTLSSSQGWPMRPQVMSVMWSKPSMPLRSMNAPKSVMFLTVPLTMVAGVHAFQEFLALFAAFLLDELAAGEDDVLPVVVDLDDLEIVGVADELLQILWRNDVDLRAGRKASTPMLTIRPPLTTDLTLPLMRPSPSKTLTILSQFWLYAAFSLERTTMPSSFSSRSRRTSTSSPTWSVSMSSNSRHGMTPSLL